MTRRADEQRTEDEEVARRLSLRIADDLTTVLNNYRRVYPESARFMVFIEQNAVRLVHETLLREVLDDPRGAAVHAATVASFEALAVERIRPRGVH